MSFPNVVARKSSGNLFQSTGVSSVLTPPDVSSDSPDIYAPALQRVDFGHPGVLHGNPTRLQTMVAVERADITGDARELSALNCTREEYG